jgi:AraC-like DNA-binding protein
MGQKLPDDFAASVARIIEMNLADQRVNLEQTAKKLSLGPRTVQRRLGEYGLSYRQLVDRCRMSRACDLLSGSVVGVEDISREVGYSCAPHFTRAFLRVYNITPSEFRMTHQHQSCAA